MVEYAIALKNTLFGVRFSGPRVLLFRRHMLVPLAPQGPLASFAGQGLAGPAYSFRGPRNKSLKLQRFINHRFSLNHRISLNLGICRPITVFLNFIDFWKIPLGIGQNTLKMAVFSRFRAILGQKWANYGQNRLFSTK